MLEPCEIELNASTTSESSLISLLQDLPHLNGLHLVGNMDNLYTVFNLGTFSVLANSLTELKINSLEISDRLLSEFIKACQLLERLLIIDDCGLVSLEAISKHSNLNTVYLRMATCISRELLEGLLLNDKVTWPSTLKERYIRAYGNRVSYKFNNKSHQWIR
eukprot:scaffold2278_cov171-Ochromonas_danica.AAC.2